MKRLRVAWSEGKARVEAARPFQPGEELMILEGEVTGRPTRYSVQVGANEHLAPPAGVATDASADTVYQWRFLNHSCQPNAAVEGRRLVAIRAVAAGEEVTFDYRCTEYDMDAPFLCHCGHCGGELVRGYRHVTAEQRRRLEPHVAPYLRKELEADALKAHA
ncbi:MAG TPA: SET domain-containing protein-lysine N-methyltransferase [Terriglobales bacterium]|nr:SET domain-containing protein-lysine N-methyltransferase [Terriglobales bacterium]